MFVIAECPNDKEVVSILILVSRTFFSVVVSGCVCGGLSLARSSGPLKVSPNTEDNFCGRQMPRQREGHEHIDFGTPYLFSVIVLGCVCVGLPL